MDDDELDRLIELELQQVVLDGGGGGFALQGYDEAQSSSHQNDNVLQRAWDDMMESGRLLDVKYDVVEHNIDELKTTTLVTEAHEIAPVVHTHEVEDDDVSSNMLLRLKQTRIDELRRLEREESERRAYRHAVTPVKEENVLEHHKEHEHDIHETDFATDLMCGHDDEDVHVVNVVHMDDTPPVADTAINEIQESTKKLADIDAEILQHKNELHVDNNDLQSNEQSITQEIQRVREQEILEINSLKDREKQRALDELHKRQAIEAFERQQRIARQMDALSRAEKEIREKKAREKELKMRNAAMVILMAYRRYVIARRRSQRRSILNRMFENILANARAARLMACMRIQRKFRAYRVKREYDKVCLCEMSVVIRQLKRLKQSVKLAASRTFDIEYEHLEDDTFDLPELLDVRDAVRTHGPPRTESTTTQQQDEMQYIECDSGSVPVIDDDDVIKVMRDRPQRTHVTVQLDDERDDNDVTASTIPVGSQRTDLEQCVNVCYIIIIRDMMHSDAILAAMHKRQAKLDSMARARQQRQLELDPAFRIAAFRRKNFK